MIHKHIGNGSVVCYFETRVCYFISSSLLLAGLVVGFFIGGMT
jgi:hypothetical protein